MKFNICENCLYISRDKSIRICPRCCSSESMKIHSLYGINKLIIDKLDLLTKKLIK